MKCIRQIKVSNNESACSEEKIFAFTKLQFNTILKKEPETDDYDT